MKTGQPERESRGAETTLQLIETGHEIIVGVVSRSIQAPEKNWKITEGEKVFTVQNECPIRKKLYDQLIEGGRGGDNQIDK